MNSDEISLIPAERNTSRLPHADLPDARRLPASGESSKGRSGRRRLLLAGLLIIGAAAATIVPWYWLDSERVPDQGTENDLMAELPVATAPAKPVAEPLLADAVAVQSQTSTATGDAAAGSAPTPWTKLIVLPARVESDDPLAAAFVDLVRQSFLRELRATSNLDLVDVSAAELSSSLGTGYGDSYDSRSTYLALSRRFGSEFVVQINLRPVAESPSIWLVSARTLTANGNGSVGTDLKSTSDARPGKDPDSIARHLASGVVGRLPSLSASAAPNSEVLAFLLDRTKPEEDRARVLSQIRGNGFSREVIDTAIELGFGARSPDTRRRIWSSLRENLFEPALAQALASVLLSDPDERVRIEAALGLEAYIDDVVTRPALQAAMDNDPSASVRFAARLSTLGPDGQRALSRATILDSSLTPTDRMLPLSVRDMRPFLPPLSDSQDDELTRALADIVAGTDEIDLKVGALTQIAASGILRLGSSDPDPFVTQMLLDSFQHENREVRTWALSGMTSYAENTEIRSALEAALTDEPELAARMGISLALERVEQQSR